MTDNLPLAAEFPPTSEAEWRKLVEAALKGASFDKRLVSQTYDGLRVEPLYPRAAGAKPVAGRAPGAAWTLMQRVDHPDPAAANKQALEDLENGATGLTLVMAGSVNANGYGLDASQATLDRVLKDVELDAGITIDFNLSPATREAAQNFAALVKARKIPPAAVDWRASVNPLGGFAVSGASPRPWNELSRSFAYMVRDLAGQGFRGPFAVADGRIIHNAGGSEAQELSFAIASAVEYLRALETGGMPLDAAHGLIYFRLSADADEFLTIAKFRALRKLWARVEQACGLTPKPAYVAAETAWRMMTKRDVAVNMLRMTIAVTAAGLGDVGYRDEQGKIRQRRQFPLSELMSRETRLNYALGAQDLLCMLGEETEGSVPLEDWILFFLDQERPSGVSPDWTPIVIWEEAGEEASLSSATRMVAPRLAQCRSALAADRAARLQLQGLRRNWKAPSGRAGATG